MISLLKNRDLLLFVLFPVFRIHGAGADHFFRELFVSFSEKISVGKLTEDERKQIIGVINIEAAIRLKKILSQNPKLIKGYHLLALIQMKNQEWNKARRTLKKAARIDKTNTTTLRFLREVDEQTGVTTKMEKL